MYFYQDDFIKLYVLCMCIVLTLLQLLEAMLSVWKQGRSEKLERKMCQE